MTEVMSALTYVGKEEAYALYRANGRSYKAVHDQTGIPLGTVKSWAATERWSERANADDRALGREVRQGADAWVLGGLAKTLKQIDDEVSRVEDVYKPSDDGLIHVVKATPPAVRAKLLIWRAELAGLVPVTANEDRDHGDDESLDPRDLNDDELFGALKQAVHR